MVTENCRYLLDCHQDNVTSMAFSADSRQLASRSNDNVIKIWCVATGSCIQDINIDKTILRQSFDPIYNPRLLIDILALNRDLSLDIDKILNLVEVNPNLYQVSKDNAWIMKQGVDVLWLPCDYRPSCSAVSGLKVAIGCHSGRVLVMHFS